MSDFRTDFLKLAIDRNVLKFGEFTLKSGRVSPYFFNAGLFNTGAALSLLGKYYAQAIVESGIEFDVLFGPAYKGIPLASVTAAALYEQHGVDVPYAFNRKEAKTHGEGGNIVGSPLEGKILVIDDVMTAGTAIRESVEIIENANAALAGVVIALDRQEKGQGDKSAVQETESRFNVPVRAIVSLTNLIEYLDQQGENDVVAGMKQYREQYGV